MNEKQQRNYDLQERLIEFAVRMLDVVESLPNSIPSFPSSLHHSLLDIRYSIWLRPMQTVGEPVSSSTLQSSPESSYSSVQTEVILDSESRATLGWAGWFRYQPEA